MGCRGCDGDDVDRFGFVLKVIEPLVRDRKVSGYSRVAHADGPRLVSGVAEGFDGEDVRVRVEGGGVDFIPVTGVFFDDAPGSQGERSQSGPVPS